MFHTSFPVSWINPQDKDVQTIYFQGIFASQAQIAKYTGDRGFIATTGEHVKCAGAPDMFYQPYVGKELDEVNLKHSVQENKYINFLKRIFLPASLIQETVSNAKCDKWGITVEPEESDETVKSFSIDWYKCDLGQNSDIAQHKCKYELCTQEYPDADIILYGASRGAATTFNAVALNKYDTSRIKLIVLESCFDSIPSLLRSWYPRMCSQAKICCMVQKLLSLGTGYRHDGPAPEKLVNCFPAHVPVVFVTSKIDTTVPSRCTKHMAQLLANRGENPVYLLELHCSSHPKYTIDDQEDRESYQRFMHTLYKNLNLPHIPDHLDDECLLEKYKLQ